MEVSEKELAAMFVEFCKYKKAREKNVHGIKEIRFKLHDLFSYAREQPQYLSYINKIRCVVLDIDEYLNFMKMLIERDDVDVPEYFNLSAI